MRAVPTGGGRLRMPQGRERTWADLQEIPDDGHRDEIVDGSLHGSPGPSRPHQVAAGRRIRDLLLAVDREVVAVSAGEAGTVDVAFRVERRPAELVGPRRRS
jgi:hypothetical protein